MVELFANRRPWSDAAYFALSMMWINYVLLCHISEGWGCGKWRRGGGMKLISQWISRGRTYVTEDQDKLRECSKEQSIYIGKLDAYPYHIVNVEKTRVQVSYKVSKILWLSILNDDNAHYENTPIQIYRKFHLQKTENFQIKKLWYFSYFCPKHTLLVVVRTASARRF